MPISLNQHNEPYICVCCTLTCRAFARHTNKLKDRPEPLKHAFKYAVSASKNKSQYCASSILSTVFNFHFQIIVFYIYLSQCLQQSSAKSSGWYAAHHLFLAMRKTNLEYSEVFISKLWMCKYNGPWLFECV